MKRTTVVTLFAGLLLLVGGPAHAQTATAGPQIIICGYPVVTCASPTGIPAQQVVQQQQQQQQQQSSSSRGTSSSGSSSGPAAAAAAASTGSGGGVGGGSLPFTGANVLRWSIAALALMAVGSLLLLNSRGRTRTRFTH